MRIRVITKNGLMVFLVGGVFLIAALGFLVRGVSMLRAAEPALADAQQSADTAGFFDDTGADKHDQVSVSIPVQGEDPVTPDRQVQFVLNPDADPSQVASAQVEWIEEDENDPDKMAGDHIKIEIAGIKAKEPEKKDQPKVLIYHTHTYEAYEQDPNDLYVEAYSAKWRTANYDYNIVRVGEELAQLLRAQGFEVVHDTTAFEPPKLGTAYVRSLEMLNSRMAAGEEYDLIIDMHRDAYSQRSWSPKAITMDGESTARLMFLIGTGEDGFKEKPNWQENYALTDSLVKKLQAMNPDLCKDVNVKTQRYNQHVSEKCILVEVGHCENTLDEAINSMKYLAQAIGSTLSK